MLRKQFTIDDLHQLHENKYDYSLLHIDDTTSLRTKVTVICEVHGPFSISLYSHVSQKKGCQRCSWASTAAKNREYLSISPEDFISACHNTHNGFYDYRETEYTGALYKIRVICPIHGKFMVRADRHKKGQGCQICMRAIRTEQKKLLQREWIERCVDTHQEQYDYSKAIYTGTESKVVIICLKHGEFKQNASHHMRGSECPRCIRRRSKIGEEWLSSLGLKLDREYFLKGLRRWADGFDLYTNTVYLFHGDYWHGNPNKFESDTVNKTIGKSFGELFEETLRTEKMIRDAGYNLVTIWESDWIKARSNPSCGRLLMEKKEG